MKRLNLLLLGAFVAPGALSSACTTTVAVPREVRVPVPVACVEPAQRPQRPALRTESDLMAMDRYRRTLAAWSDLKKYEAYAAELEALVEGCARLPSP